MTFRAPHRAALLGLLLLCGCSRSDEPLPVQLPLGTWGGDGAGVLVAEDDVHVHVGCTKGEIRGPVPLDEEGRFDVAGRHNVDAYPVDRGIYHPARYRGRASAHEMTFSVELADTGQVLGPATVFFGREPRLGPCPICRR